MIEDRQTWLMGHATRVGDSELYSKLKFLEDNSIKLNDWQLAKFTGYDRGIGKTFVAILTNVYNDTENIRLDPDTCDSENRARYFRMMLKAAKSKLSKSC